MAPLLCALLAAAPLTQGSQVAALLGEEVEVRGVLERVAVSEGGDPWQGTGLLLDDDTVVFVTYGAPPEGWHAHLGFAVRVRGRLSPSIGDRAHTLIAPHLRAAGPPVRDEREPGPLAGQRVRLAGLARTAKGGAVLLVGGQPVFLEGVERWPRDVERRRVAAGGTLATVDLPPVPATGPRGERKAAAAGRKLLLRAPAWRPVEAPAGR